MDAFEIFEQMFSGGIFNEHEQREQEEAAQQAAQALEGLELELACGGNSDYRLLYSEEEDEEEDECVGSDARAACTRVSVARQGQVARNRCNSQRRSGSTPGPCASPGRRATAPTTGPFNLSEKREPHAN